MARKLPSLTSILLVSTVYSPAWVDSVCSGTLIGSVLQALPRPTSVTVVQPVSDDANPGLAQQFLNGIQAGGFTVAPAGQGNTQVDATSTVTAGPAASNATFKGFAWMSGMQLPGGANGSLTGSMVSLSVEATDTTTQTLAWIGTVKCTSNTGDPNALAEHLGELVARTLGKSVEQRSF